MISLYLNKGVEPKKKEGPEMTFHNYGKIKDGNIIDYIFTSDDINIKFHKIIDDKPDNCYISDHYPVMVDVCL